MENLDEKLYEDYKNGEKEAFEHLYNKYKNKIQYFINNIIKDKEKAEDIAQETFIYVLQHPKRDGYSFKYYIYLVAKSRAINYINTEKNRNEINEKYLSKEETVENDIYEIVAKKEKQKEITYSSAEECIKLSQEIITNKIAKYNGEDKRIIQVQVNSGINNNLVPIKSSLIKVQAPKIALDYSESVIIRAATAVVHAAVHNVHIVLAVNIVRIIVLCGSVAYSAYLFNNSVDSSHYLAVCLFLQSVIVVKLCRLKVKLQEFVKADQGELIIDNGKMWYATWSEYSIFYPIKLATDLGTDYYLTNALLTVDHQVIAYDRMQNRFLWYDRWENPPTLYGETVRNGELQYYNVNGSSNRARLKRIAEVPEYPNVFNPDETGLQDVLFMGVHSFGGLGASMKGMAVGRKQGSAQWHIYEFNNDGLSNGDRARCSGYYTFMPSAGDEDSWQFASSCYFNNIFFYASGNKIYRWYYNTATSFPTEPWRTLDDLEGAEITSLAVSPDNQQLYVGVYQPQASGLNGSFYLLNCNTGKNEGDSPYLNVAYKPLKVVYKPR